VTEAFNFGNPTDPDNSDGGLVYVFGCEWESAVAGLVTGGRWRRPTNAPGVLCYMLLYRKSDMAELARKTFTPSAGDNDITFDSAVSASASTRYVSAVLADRYAFTVGGFPFTTTNLTAPAGVNGRLATTVADTPVYPSNIHGSAANFFIGPLFTPTSVDAAGTAAGTGSGTGDAFVTRIAAGSGDGLGSAAADAVRIAVVAGTAAGIGAASASATVVTPSGHEAAGWSAGRPHGRWHAGPPHSRWHAGPPGGS
jgi:hypothetical protein